MKHHPFGDYRIRSWPVKTFAGSSLLPAASDQLEERQELGFHQHLLLVCVVLSLCGSMTEFIDRYYSLPLNPTTLLMSVSFVLMIMRSGSSVRQGQVLFGLILLLVVGWGAIGLLLAPFADLSAYASISYALLGGGMLTWCLMWLPGQEWVLKVLCRYSACGLIVMAIAFLPLVLLGLQPPGPTIAEWHIHAGVARIPWTLDDPNYFAANLVLMVLFCYCGVENSDNRFEKTLCVAGMCSGVVLVLLAMSRAGIGALILGLVTCAALGQRHRILSLLLLVIGAGIVAQAGLLNDIFHARFVHGISEDGALEVRLEQYRYAFRLGIDNLLGVGLGQSEQLAVSVASYRIHSTFLEFLAELGMIGFTLLACVALILTLRWFSLGLVCYRFVPRGVRTALWPEWTVLSSQCLSVIVVASSIAMANRTAVWTVIGLMGWFAVRRTPALLRAHGANQWN